LSRYPSSDLGEHLGAADDEIIAADGEIGAAFDRIVDATVRLMDLSECMPEDRAEIFDGAIAEILEAAAMRDIAGQRLTAARNAVRALSGSGAPTAAALAPGQGDAALLNGPQRPGAAPSQSDIDALFDKAE